VPSGAAILFHLELISRVPMFAFARMTPSGSRVERLGVPPCAPGRFPLVTQRGS